MPRITQTTRLERVEHVLGSGVGILDFAVEGEQSYYTWEGAEATDWEIEDVDHVENAEEDRFVIYLEGDYFTCEVTIGADPEDATVRCWSE